MNDPSATAAVREDSPTTIFLYPQIVGFLLWQFSLFS